MQVAFEKFDVANRKHLASFCQWDANQDLLHLRYPRFGPEPIHIRSKDEIIARYQGTEKEISGMYMIACKDKYIGEVSVDINHPQLYCKKHKSAWLGLAICEPTYWGTGVAQQALTFIEQIAKDLGAKRMELGTFEFNHRARRFYEKCGYQHIATLAKITYWQGRYWNDIRYEKNFETDSVAQ